MILKAVRSAIRLSILFVLIQGLNYYRLVLKYTPQPNPYARFGGNTRQAAFCIQLLLILNFILFLIGDIYKKKELKHYTGLLFTNLSRPICLVYSSVVWLNVLVASNQILIWTASNRRCPKWFGHTIYSLPAIAVLVESFLEPHRTVGYWRPVRDSFISFTLFLTWHLGLWFLDDRLPNRLFDQSSWKQILFVVIICSLTLMWVGIGYLIDWVVFDLPSDNYDREKSAINRRTNHVNSEQDQSEDENNLSGHRNAANLLDGNIHPDGDFNAEYSSNVPNSATFESKKDD